MRKSLFLIFTLMLANIAIANDDVLAIDRVVDKNVQIAFPNDDNMSPRRSEFELLNFVLMSSESGERWAVVTLKNTSTGKRIFEQDQLMALLANGTRIYPQEIKQTFEGGEVISLNVHFGKKQFPILNITTYIP